MENRESQNPSTGRESDISKSQSQQQPSGSENRQQQPAARTGDRCGIPRHGDPRRQLATFPIHPEALAGIELTAADMAAREEPAERAFRQVHRHRPDRPPLPVPIVRA